ncbi:uncharacterized protein TNCV_4373851 [Trichonephila clavipes]|uniref:Uncharacterized protein n=1 Tax=Trichonephila clavipes TaxID=2585209 RepID=A0A8X6R4D4_TRICX|nr:uncharacterized protein TNCV_4373851 [Trichonephila clavipes]
MPFFKALFNKPKAQKYIGEASGLRNSSWLWARYRLGFRSFEHHTGDSTIWLRSTLILRKNTLEVVRDLPPLLLLPTSRQDLRLDGYLEYPHAAKARHIYKHPCLFRDSNPDPTASSQCH